jgi:hypothetical protein
MGAPPAASGGAHPSELIRPTRSLYASVNLSIHSQTRTLQGVWDQLPGQWRKGSLGVVPFSIRDCSSPGLRRTWLEQKPLPFGTWPE